jgi:hypothetical protein
MGVLCLYQIGLCYVIKLDKYNREYWYYVGVQGLTMGCF